MKGIAGKVAIVTGGATLIGQKVAEAFLAYGARVVIADIAEEAGTAFADRHGPEAAFLRTDVREDADIAACVEETGRRFGGVDFLVNLACTYLDNGIDSTRAEWLEALNVNLVGAAIFTRIAADAMAARGGGAVVNIASISGKRAQPGRMLYSASKAALLQLTRNQAMQLAEKGIRVNSVSPGWTWSNIMVELTGNRREKADQVAAPFHILGRTGDPAEVGEAVVFLCSDHARFITGADLPVDGGYTAIGPEGLEDAVGKLAEA